MGLPPESAQGQHSAGPDDVAGGRGLRVRLVVALLLGSVLVHFPSHPADFSFDDRAFVVENLSIRSLESALATFAAPFPPQQSERGLYRPWTAVSYALDHAAFGLDAWGYHLSNVLLYAMAVLLVARLAYWYRPSRGFALSVGLLFSLHPVHCEVVDSVTGRSELLMLVFVVAALLLFASALRPDRAGSMRGDPRALLAASLVCYALACASKETGVVLPGILAAHCLAYGLATGGRLGSAPWRRALSLLGPFAAVLLVYLALRVNAIGHFAPSDPVLAGASAWARLHTVGAVFLEYLRLLAFPSLLQIDFHYQQSIGIQETASLRSMAGLFSLLLLLAVFALSALQAFAALRRRRHSGPSDPSRRAVDARLVCCSLVIFFAFLFPVSHVIDIGALMAERFLFAPSLGIVLLVVHLADRGLARLALPVARRRALAACAVAVLALAGGWRSQTRAAEWRDSLALWQSAARHVHGDARVYANLGEAHLVRGELEAAERELGHALAIDAGNIDALGNLALVHWERGRADQAGAAFRRLLSADPEDAMAWNNLGVIEARNGRHDRALPYFDRALELNENLALAHRNRAASERALASSGVRPGD